MNNIDYHMLSAETPPENTQTQQAVEFKLNPDSLVESLPVMLKGMVGIFITIGVIMFCVFCLNKLFKPKGS